MCGIVGVLADKWVNQVIYDALTVLQHRGQDAAGITTCTPDGRLAIHKGKGLVAQVFNEAEMQALNKGRIGIGHVRYPTAGFASSALEAQPFYVNSPYGIALAHNGNLTNAEELEQELVQFDLRHINTHSDSEVLLNVLAHEIQQLKRRELTPEDIFTAVAALHKRCKGAYAVIALFAGKGLLAFRDPFGIRPLVFGMRKTPHGIKEYMFASESVALDINEFELIDDLKPGEAIYIDMQGEVTRKQCADKPQLTPCLFEYVYLARPDSIIDKISVYKMRLRMGEYLAEKILQTWSSHDIDVVIPVPETSRTAAMTLAKRLNIKYRDGFVKNAYIGRTFIMPEQELRQKSVRHKLNPIALEFKDKNVLLVDDSIVRGTTSREIIQMARDAGAKKVYFASAAPEVCYPNVYGIDIPKQQELIAYQRDNDAICQTIGADRLIYQDLSALIKAAHEGNPAIQSFEASVFNGKYYTV